MPLYKYRCPECNKVVTEIERVMPNEIRKCPECEERMIREKINSFSSRYSGSGFYSTDYGDNKKGIDE